MEILIHNLSHSDIIFDLQKCSHANDEVIMARPKFGAFKLLTKNIYNCLCDQSNGNTNDQDRSNDRNDTDDSGGHSDNCGDDVDAYRSNKLNFEFIDHQSSNHHQFQHSYDEQQQLLEDDLIMTKLQSRTFSVDQENNHSLR